MLRKFAIACGLVASLVSSGHSSGRVDSVSFATEQGDEQRLKPFGDNFRHDLNQYTVQLERVDKGQARIRFTYTANGREISELLEAPFDEVPPVLALDDLTYDPTTPLRTYMQKLNDQRLPHKRVFEWNRAREVTLGNEMTPLVRFNQDYTLRFWSWKYKHSMERHESYVYFRYGPSQDQILGKYLVHTCAHRFKKTPLENIVYLTGDKLREVASVVFYDAPWFEQNQIATHLPYARPEAHSDGVMVLNAPQGASDKYYQPQGFEWLPSRYIYADGQGQCFITKLKRVTLAQMQYQDHGKDGVRFTKIEGLPLVHLMTLDRLNAPILLPPNRQITPAFNRGYYELTRVQIGDLGQRIEQYIETPYGNEHEFTHAQSPALQGFSATDLLLNTPEPELPEIIACVKHFLPDMDPARTFKILIRFPPEPNDSDQKLKEEKRKKLKEDKSKVGNRLLRLLAADPRLVVDAEGLDGELSHDQDVLRDEAVATFLTLLGRVPNLKVILREVAIGNWNTIASLQNHQVLARIQPKFLRMTLAADEDLESVKQFISANSQLTHLYLSGFTGRLDIPFLAALADHKKLQHLEIQDQDGKGFLDRGHLGRLKPEGKSSVWLDQKDALAAKWRGIKSLDFRGDKYPFQYNITGIDLLTANVETITCLYLTGLKGFKQYGSKLVAAVDKMTNLALIELMGDVLDNFETVAMARALSTKQHLTYVTIDMPYWVSNIFALPADAFHELQYSRSIGDFCSNLFVTGMSVAISPLLILADLDGNQSPHYTRACSNLAIIPQLSFLKLVLWGALPYRDWTINFIKKERKEANLPDAEIEIAK